jgi:hypothetical protein
MLTCAAVGAESLLFAFGGCVLPIDTHGLHHPSHKLAPPVSGRF